MLKLYKPQLEDLWFREALMNDPETMSYNRAWGGTIPFPKEKWSDWYRKWITEPEGKRFYRYLLWQETNQFVGEIAYHFDHLNNIYIANIIVCAQYRCRGYGREGLKLLCDAAKSNGVTMLYDDIAVDNPSVQLFLKNGFTIDYRTDDFIMVKRTI